MYNDRMPANSYEIRVCNECGLRYPLVEGHPFGIRCPICMGDTRVILTQKLVTEPSLTRPVRFNRGDVDRGNKETRGKNFTILMDNIRSAWNVGAILRSADGFGFAHAYLCGITPTPDGPSRESVTKTSLGAEESVTWSYHKDAVRLVKGLKKVSWTIFALEEDKRSLAIDNPLTSVLLRTTSAQRVILIVGNEVTGVDPELLDLCDQIFYIPMYGQKGSFNVAIAFGIAAYALSVQS
jgi:23S rRNA (guanosine2251-2'-O)-methyltransferase